MQDEDEVRSLYTRLLNAWNRRAADEYAALFSTHGFAVGFDGTTHADPQAMRSELTRIFADHPTATYVSKVRDVRRVGGTVAILRAVAGMVPPGRSDLKPEVNAIQTLVAVREQAGWRIALFQNTPAAFHGKPELVAQLSDELRAELNQRT